MGGDNIDIFDALVLITTPLFVSFAAYPLLERFSYFKRLNFSEKFLSSLTVGLAVVLLPLYLVGILSSTGFRVASVLIYIIGGLLITAHVIVRLRDFPRVFSSLKRVAASNPVLIASVVIFMIKYSIFLLFKGIIDWDASSYYLPHARIIIDQDKIPLFPELPLRPIGISVLYSWVYALSSSTAAENFRLVPLPFTFAVLLMTYLIAKSLFSEKVATLAVMVYIFMPLHDWTLFISSFYPDVVFDTLFLGVIYFMYRYVKTGGKGYGFLCGFALGLSTFMKVQGLNIYPMVLLVLLPYFDRRRVRFLVSFLTPLAFLLGLPSLLPAGLNNVFMEENLVAICLVFLLAALIYLVSSRTANAIGSLGRNPLKMLLLVCIVSLPFVLIWFLRNYYFYGTFISEGNIDFPPFQFATAFLRSLGNSQNTQALSSLYSIHLSSLFSFLTISYLGTMWLLPKLLGMIKSATWNGESVFLYIWFIGQYMWYFFALISSPDLTNVINFRWLFSIAPILAIFSAVGIFLLIKFFTGSENINKMIILAMFLGVFSVAQSSLMYLFRPSPFDSLVKGPSLQLGSLWTALTGELAWYPENIVAASSQLLMFGVAVSVLSLVLIELTTHPLSHRLKTTQLHFPRAERIRSIFRMKKPNFMSKRSRFISLTLLILLATQLVPYVAIIYHVSGGDLVSFKDKERLMFDFHGLYSEILPYLRKNIHKGDAIVAVDVRESGLYYYLNDAKFIDVETLLPYLYPDSGINASRALSIFNSLSVRYFLLPGTYSGVTGQGKQLMEELSKITSLLSIVRNTEYFTLANIQTKEWELYEFTRKTHQYVGFSGFFLQADAYLNIMGNFTVNESFKISNQMDLQAEIRADVSGGAFNWSKPIAYSVKIAYDLYYLPAIHDLLWKLYEGSPLLFTEESKECSLNQTLNLNFIEEIREKRAESLKQYEIRINSIELTAKQNSTIYLSRLLPRNTGYFVLRYNISDGWWIWTKSSGLIVESQT